MVKFLEIGSFLRHSSQEGGRYNHLAWLFLMVKLSKDMIGPLKTSPSLSW